MCLGTRRADKMPFATSRLFSAASNKAYLLARAVGEKGRVGKSQDFCRWHIPKRFQPAGQGELPGGVAGAWTRICTDWGNISAILGRFIVLPSVGCVANFSCAAGPLWVQQLAGCHLLSCEPTFTLKPSGYHLNCLGHELSILVGGEGSLWGVVPHH